MKQATVSKKSVLLICVFLVGFITQHPRYLIIYTSNQNLRIACLLKSVIAVRKYVTATHILFLSCLITTVATLIPRLPPFSCYFSRWVERGKAQQVSPGGRGSPLVGISLNHLCQVFSKTNGGGPKAYVTEICICASFPNALIFFLLRD